MSEIKVSVIMPSLNVVDYIEECLLSALNQTLEEIEILCIDAKSTDGTWELLNKYADNERYKSKIRLIQSDIKSYGYQVNLGIKEAKGKYIAIIETDDYVELNMYRELYELADKNNADMVRSDYASFFVLPNGNPVYQEVHLWEKDSSYYNRIICPEQIEYLYQHDYNVWKGIYKKDFLIKNKIFFNESEGAAFQDIGFMLLVLACADRVLYTDKVYYRYRIDREMSSVNSINSLKFIYQEFYRLLNHSELYSKFEFPKGLYHRMIDAIFVEYSKVLKLVEYNLESEYIMPYYKWFREVLLNAINQEIFQIELLDKKIQNKLFKWLYHNEVFISEIRNEMERNEFYFQRFLNKNIYIFGAGQIGKNFIIQLLKNGVVPICVCDNDEKKWGEKLIAIDIVSPQKGVEIYKNDIKEKTFIIANKYHYEEIEQQLVNCSISKNEIMKSI